MESIEYIRVENEHGEDYYCEPGVIGRERRTDDERLGECVDGATLRRYSGTGNWEARNQAR